MGIQVLVVDDSMLIRQVVKKVLKQAGLSVDQFFEAGDGQQALDIIQKEDLQLVLCDINMPTMDGLEMLMQLRQMDDKIDLPVIMITTEGSKDTIQEAMSLGANGYILKPFTSEAVVEQLIPLNLISQDGMAAEEVDLSDPDAF